MSSSFAPVNNIRGICKREDKLLVRQSHGIGANAGIVEFQRSRNGRPDVAASIAWRD